MTQKLLKVGSSAAVTIPKKSLKELGLKIGDEVRVDINVTQRVVMIEPAKEVNSEIIEWTDRFIKKYKPALDALSRK